MALNSQSDQPLDLEVMTRTVCSTREAKKRIQEGTAKPWEHLGRWGQNIRIERIQREIITVQRMLLGFRDAPNPLTKLHSGISMLCEIEAAAEDVISAQRIANARDEAQRFLTNLGLKNLDIEASLSIDELREGLDRLAHKRNRAKWDAKERTLKKEIENQEKAVMKAKEESMRKDIIQKLGLKANTSFANAQAALAKAEQQAREEDENEILRKQIIEQLSLPEDTTLASAKALLVKFENENEKRLRLEEENQKRRRLGLGEQANILLAEKLHAAFEDQFLRIRGYLYLRCWALSDSDRWYKIGMTNNPNRREAEQNVLPVAAETLVCVELPSLEHAKTAEKATLQLLVDFRIRNASNRELLRLQPDQVAALVGEISRLGPCVKDLGA